MRYFEVSGVRSYLLFVFLLVSFLSQDVFSQPSNGERVPVVDLAYAMGIPVEEFFLSDFKNSPIASGKYFRYIVFPGENPRRGLLVPLKDQTRTFVRDNGNFGALVIDGSIPIDSASSLYDKIDQLRRLEHFGGPRLYAIGLIHDKPNKEGIPEISLVVEHIPGVRFERVPELRSPQENARYLDLFLEMSRPLHLSIPGHLPLDYNPDNVLQVGDQLKPIDAALITEREIDLLRTYSPQLIHLKEQQAAYTLISIEDSLRAHPYPREAECHRLLGEIRRVIPTREKLFKFVHDELQLQRAQSPGLH